MYAPCEVCGKRESEFLASIEGAKLNSCYSCAKVGRIIRSLDSQEGGSSPTPPDSTNSNVPFAFREEDKIIDGYGIIIRDARRAKNLRREEVAKEINEKESFLDHIEKEKTRPPFKVLKKLEKFLNVKLIEKTTPSVGHSESLKSNPSRGYTLADALEFEKKKGE